MATLGQTLRKMRKDKGLTQEEMEQLTGVPQASLSGYERDERWPPPDVMMILAKSLGKFQITVSGKKIKFVPVTAE
jgi:transcriptional regulator with XRE-family HTH domain